jgi:hypothetical protein
MIKIPYIMMKMKRVKKKRKKRRGFYLVDMSA